MSLEPEPEAVQQMNAGSTGDVIELEPSIEIEVSSPPPSMRAALVAGSRASLASETTSLLHARLRAVAILLTVVYGIVLVWAVANEGTGLFTSFDLYRNMTALRLVFLAAVLGLLYARASYSQVVLRGVEYTLFGVLTLVWVYSRYGAMYYDVQERDLADLLVGGREAMIGLFMLMIVHGLLIPHRWQGTAQVVLTMALAPTAALVLFQLQHPQLAEQFEELLSWRNVSTEVLVVLVGAILAIYGSSVLNSLRGEVHAARKYGQYQLVDKIGGGGMGDVFLAEHALMKRPCALKTIRTEAAGDPTAMARFQREVHTTAGLTHPNTIEIYDYGHAEDGTFYYVMEYLPGLSIAELIATHGPAPPSRVIYLLRQICSALAEAHAAGLIHRDLKPGNVIVSERGGMCDFVKVLDFGLVKLTGGPDAAHLTGDQVVSGTPLYMSPEQAMGDRGLDGRSDLYAVGAIAYFMLTGRPPFEGESPVAVMVAHASQEVVPPSENTSGIPADLESIVVRCLAKKPDDRYADVLALRDALDRCTAAQEWDVRQAAAWWQTITS